MEVEISEYRRATFMEENGFDIVKAESFPLDEKEEEEVEEDEDGEVTYATFRLVRPDATKDEQKSMYTAQIERLIVERDKFTQDYNDLIDRLKASIEILE